MMVPSLATCDSSIWLTMPWKIAADESKNALPVAAVYCAPSSKNESHVASSPPKAVATSARSVGRPAASNRSER